MRTAWSSMDDVRWRRNVRGSCRRLIRLDDSGYPIVYRRPIPPSLKAHVRRAIDARPTLAWSASASTDRVHRPGGRIGHDRRTRDRSSKSRRWCRRQRPSDRIGRRIIFVALAVEGRRSSARTSLHVARVRRHAYRPVRHREDRYVPSIGLLATMGQPRVRAQGTSRIGLRVLGPVSSWPR